MKKVRMGRGDEEEELEKEDEDQDEDQGHPTRVRKSKGCQDSGNI